MPVLITLTADRRVTWTPHTPRADGSEDYKFLTGEGGNPLTFATTAGAILFINNNFPISRIADDALNINHPDLRRVPGPWDHEQPAGTAASQR